MHKCTIHEIIKYAYLLYIQYSTKASITNTIVHSTLVLVVKLTLLNSWLDFIAQWIIAGTVLMMTGGCYASWWRSTSLVHPYWTVVFTRIHMYHGIHLMESKPSWHFPSHPECSSPPAYESSCWVMLRLLLPQIQISTAARSVLNIQREESARKSLGWINKPK